ncbi:hypothetical protein RFI_23244, partial [Reticulomyxa filosa]
GKDTFILPREGERDRIEQYLTYKYVEKKWYKEKLKNKDKDKDKEQKTKKVENKKGEEESGSETEEAPTPVQKKKSVTQTKPSPATSSRKAPLQQPEDDLFSFVPVDSNQTTTKGSNNTSTTTDSNWDPWGNENSTNVTTTSAITDADWEDDLWGDNNAQTNNTTTTATTTTNTKRNSQNLTSLYQTPNSTVSGGGFQSTRPMSVGVNAPMNMTTSMGMHPTAGYSIPINMAMNRGVEGGGGMMPMWGIPSTGTVPSQPVSQSNSFLGALSQVNQQKQEEIEKKKQEDETVFFFFFFVKTNKMELIINNNNNNPETKRTILQHEKKTSDPFASLIDGIDLNTNENSSSNTNSFSRDSNTTKSVSNQSNLLWRTKRRHEWYDANSSIRKSIYNWWTHPKYSHVWNTTNDISTATHDKSFSEYQYVWALCAS